MTGSTGIVQDSNVSSDACQKQPKDSTAVGKRILVVDDVGYTRLILRRFLEFAGSSVDEASTGAEAAFKYRRTVKKNCDLITLTIGGNDLLLNQDHYLRDGLSSFAEAHLNLLNLIRRKNPHAVFIVGNVYAPQFQLTAEQQNALDEANSIIERNIQGVDGKLADIHGAFRGHENEYLCLEIEPTFKGATAIAEGFEQAFHGNKNL